MVAEPIGARADHRARVRKAARIVLPAINMLWQDRQAHQDTGDKACVGCVQRNAQIIRRQRLYGADICQRHKRVRMLRHILKGKGHIGAGDIGSVVPARLWIKRELYVQAILRHLPAAGQLRRQGAGFILPQQVVEHKMGQHVAKPAARLQIGGGQTPIGVAVGNHQSFGFGRVCHRQRGLRRHNQAQAKRAQNGSQSVSHEVLQ